MKVSVIIPCYNFEDYIEQSILSVVAQKTNFEFEILVRDDFSTDKSQLNIERVANFNTNVRFFNPEENWGGDKNIKFLFIFYPYLIFIFYL
jgi:glycosyltransferase involved in cell wall biosynthesis